VAQHKSAIKRIRRNERARVRNRQYLSSVKTAVKKFRAAVLGAGQGSFDKEQVRPLFMNAQMMLAKAANKGILHKNNASRKISRLSAMLRSAEAGEVAKADLRLAKKSAATRRAEAAAAASAAGATVEQAAAAGKKAAAASTKAKKTTAGKKTTKK